MTVCEFRRGGTSARDKNTYARLRARNAGGAYAHLRNTTETKSYAEAHDTIVSKLFLQDVLGG